MRRLVLFALLALAACSETITPEMPPAAVPFPPPAVYAEWWAIVQAEAGVRGDPASARFFVVRGGSWMHSRFGPTYGLWFGDGRIFLAEGWTMDRGLVMHEMLHHVLQGDETHAHPLFLKYQRGGDAWSRGEG